MNRNKTKIFSSFGEQLSAVHNAAKPGSVADERLANLGGMNSGTPTDGGYLVQSDFITDLSDVIYQEQAILKNVRRIPVSTNSNTLKINGIDEKSRVDGSRWGGVQAFWESNAKDYAESKPSFKHIEIKLQKLCGLCYATDELLEDAPALGDVIRTAFADEFSFQVADKVLHGTGVGEPLGIFNSGALTTVEAEEGQTDILVPENIIKMLAACDDRYGRAEWYVNKELLPHLITLKIGNTPIFIPENSMANTPYGTLLGRRVNYIEQAEGVGNKGDILLADMGQYIIAEKAGGTKYAESIHVRFLYDETAFRFTYRVNGCPAVESAVTPYKGKQPVSPFVTLAARIQE